MVRCLTFAMLAAGLALALALAGCGGEDTAVSVRLYPAEGAAHEGLLAGDGADTLEIVLETDGDRFVESFALADGRGSVRAVPTGEGYRFTVRGFAGADNTVQLYGASHPFDVAPGDAVEVPVQVGRGDCVGLNRAAPTRDPADGGSADLHGRRVGASVTRLPDGRILLIGGAEVAADGTPERILDTAEIYDPTQSQFVPLPWRLILARAWHTATLLPDGQVLVVGGVVGLGPSGVTVTDTAALIAPDEVEAVRPLGAPIPAEGRAFHTAQALPDGSVLVAGGEGPGGEALASAVRFMPPAGGDPIAGRFRVQGPLHAARSRFTLSRTGQTANPALVVGGLGAGGPVAPIELFTTNPAQSGCAGGGNPTDDIGCFIRPSGVELSTPRWGHGAAVVEGGAAVLIVGGYASADRGAPVAEVARIDLGNFQPTVVGALATPRGEAAVAAIADGAAQPYVLVAGGYDGAQPVTAVTRLVPADDPAAPGRLRYAEAALADGCALSEPRHGLHAVVLDTRTALLLGGITRSPAGLTGSRRIEVFFPRINGF